MPSIGAFDRLLFRRFFNGHAPPRCRAQYAEFKATVGIKLLTITSGALPRRAQEQVLDWAALHQEELMQDWRLCMDKQQPEPIEPLQ
jgi:hypothetical protein